MSFDIIPGAKGTAHTTLTAVGEEGYASVTRTFTVLIEANLPPTIDTHPPVDARVGLPFTVRFTGVSGGNFTIAKPLTIRVNSSNPTVLAQRDLQAENPNGGRYLFLRGTPRHAGFTHVTITLDDQMGGNVHETLTIHAVSKWNNLPTLAPHGDMQAFVDSGDQQTPLTGISDGNDGTQRLTITAISSDANILPNPTVTASGGETAILHCKPTSIAGSASVTVTVRREARGKRWHRAQVLRHFIC